MNIIEENNLLPAESVFGRDRRKIPMSQRKEPKAHQPGCLHNEPGVTICTCDPRCAAGVTARL
jgi:hypothetical protein